MQRLAQIPTGLGLTIAVDLDPEAGLAIGRLTDTATGRPALNAGPRQLALADEVLRAWFLEPTPDQNIAGARIYAPAMGWTAAGWREVFGPMLEGGVPVAA